MKYAIAIALLSVTTVTASPYYVGENLSPKNNISLGFADTPTKKDYASAKSGNIMALEVKGAYNVFEGGAVRASLPFYMANKNASGTGESRNALGNISLGGIWGQAFKSQDQAWTYGYTLSTDIYAPTSRKLIEGQVVGGVNPTTDLWKYMPKTITATPTLGIHAAKDMFSVKTNIGGAVAYIQESSVEDQSRMAITWQTAGSWHALPNLSTNLEYNTVYLDTATGGTKRFKHAVTPSLSGNYESMIASAYATLPLDKTTRDATAVSFGINAGYTF